MHTDWNNFQRGSPMDVIRLNDGRKELTKHNLGAKFVRRLLLLNISLFFPRFNLIELILMYGNVN